MEFYNDPLPWNLPRNCYPTNDDVIRYYMSRTKDRNKSKVIYDLANIVKEIWESGDGCPKDVKNIRSQFNGLYDTFKTYQKKKYGMETKSHRKKIHSQAPILPSRRSKRIGGNSSVTAPEKSTTAANVSVNSPPAKVARSSSRNLPTNSLKEEWMKDYGKKLFDVKSTVRVQKIHNVSRGEIPECFDEEYYHDQLDPEKRTKFIDTQKVTKEFEKQERSKLKRMANKESRTLSAKGMTTIDQTEEVGNFDELSQSSEASQTSASSNDVVQAIAPVSSQEPRLSVLTRSHIDDSTLNYTPELVSIGTQTIESFNIKDVKSFPNVSTRMNDNGRACHPRYLQAGLLIMALCNASPSQSVMCMYIIDTVIYQQTRSLPLRLQKEYQRKLKLMKKYMSTTNNQTDNSFLSQVAPDISSCDLDVEIPLNDDVDFEVNQENEEFNDMWISEVIDDIHDEKDEEPAHSPQNITQRAEQAQMFVESAKIKQKANRNVVLPDPRSIRYAHQVASCFLEGEISHQMVEKKSYLMPDGTSRSKVGKMAGSLVHIEGKVRALKTHKIGADTRENWAVTIIQNLNRLATASNLTVEEIYKSINAIISDSVKANKGLAKEISLKLGTQWLPGQLYCCIHTVLGWQNGMVKKWLDYQENIGYDKMYPCVTGFELDMEDKSLIKQILECFLRLTADRWQERAWNRYDAYTKFCKDRDMLNMGQELHGQRFGALEKCCAIGVYSIGSWVDFVNERSEIRNELAIFLRDTRHLNDICTLLWLGPALIGIHLTEPYLALLIDHQATHFDLLQIFPQLFREMTSGSTNLAQILTPAFPSLKDVWIDPLSPKSPYKKEVGKAIQEAITRCDAHVLGKYTKDLVTEMAIIFQRQRGDAYGFGLGANPSEHVTVNLTNEGLKYAPTHTKDIENLFGQQDAVLTRFGAQAFDKSSDDMVLKNSYDLLPLPEIWCTKKTRRVAKQMKMEQNEFDTKQRALIEAGVTLTDADVLSKETQLLKFVQQCRSSHNGPLNSPDEVEDLVRKFENDKKKLRSALTKEIRYRKYSSYSIKFDNPLFSQKKCDESTLIANLKLLLMKTDVPMAARATMDDLEAVITSTHTLDKRIEPVTTEIAVEVEDGILPDTPVEKHTIDDEEELGMRSDWPPIVGEHIAANFSDGFYIEEVIDIIDSCTVKVSYMSPKSILTAEAGEHDRRFWIWPTNKDVFNTDKSCILNLKPCLTLAKPPSTKRMFVFSCDNAELLDIIANTVSEEI